MNFEQIENTWRAGAPRPGAVDVSLLAREVRSNARLFDILVFWRDVREVGICLLLVPLWWVLGARLELPWTWYLGIPAALFVATFLVVDRAVQKRRRGTPGDSVEQALAHSIEEARHQIRLLRNVFWWYSLPGDIACTAFFLHVGWNSRGLGIAAAILTAILLAIMVAVTWLVYWLNQRAIEKELLPRLRELEEAFELLTSNECPKGAEP